MRLEFSILKQRLSKRVAMKDANSEIRVQGLSGLGLKGVSGLGWLAGGITSRRVLRTATGKYLF